MNTSQQAIDSALEALLQLIRQDAVLREEFDESKARFHQRSAAEGSPAEADEQPGRRHAEWFALERHSAHLRGAPVERLDGELRKQADDGDVDALLASLTGAFVVSSVQPQAGLWLRDIAGLGEYPVAEPQGSLVIKAGDLIVGRLYPLGDSTYHVSSAAGFFRDAHLVQALEDDIERTRASAASKVLHISQHELETMFWGRRAATVERDPVGDARRLLLAAGLALEDIETMFGRLRLAPLDADNLLPGVGDELAAILEELAFETELDLERARQALLQAWTHMGREDDGAPAQVQGQAQVRNAVAEFARARKQGGDLDALISKLQGDLQIEDLGDGEPADDEAHPAPDFPGVVGAMIDEFLWETGLTRKDDKERFTILKALAEFSKRVGVFEEFGANDLLQFTAFWIHEQGMFQSVQEVNELLDALEAFCRWTQEQQELPLWADFHETLDGLRESLPRVAQLNASLCASAPTNTEDHESLGELFEIHHDEDTADIALIDRSGNMHTTIELPAEVKTVVRGGEFIRADIDVLGRVTPYRFYPQQSKGLLGA